MNIFTRNSLNFQLKGIQSRTSNIHTAAIFRLYRMINFGHGTVPDYLTVSIFLNNCEPGKNAYTFVIMEKQMKWEETACGTEQMREWCDELPGRAINLMTRDPISNKSFFSHFQCQLPHESEQTPKLMVYSRTHWSQLIFPGLVFLCILGIIYK